MMRVIWLAAFAIGCHAASKTTTIAASPPPPAAYQHRWGGMSVRAGDTLIDAPAELAAVAQGYPAWPHKGGVVDGIALTVMTAKTDYAIGETIAVVHVVDVAVANRGVYIMGPKVPAGEFVDGTLATGAPELPDYPWVASYDGVVLPSPAIDYNYDVTAYHFAAPGTHVIEWRLGKLRSNVITVHVR